MIVHPPTADEVDGHAAEMYRVDLATDGIVFRHTAVLAINPEAHAAFEALVSTIVASLGVHDYELATLGAARAIPSPHCLLQHARKARAAGVMDERELERFGLGDDSFLSARDAAIVCYAAKLSSRVDEMTDADSQELRDVGFDDRHIVDITLAAAVRNLLSRTLQALTVPLDDVAGISPALRRAMLSPVDRLREDSDVGSLEE